MNTQQIIHGDYNRTPYISKPDLNNDKTFGNLKVGEAIYKVYIDEYKIYKYEIIEISEYTSGQKEFSLKLLSKNKYTLFNNSDYADDVFRAFDNHTYEYERASIGINNNIAYIFNKKGLENLINDQLKPIIEKFDNLKETFQYM